MASSPPAAPSLSPLVSPPDASDGATLNWFNETLLSPTCLVLFTIAGVALLYHIYLVIVVLGVARDDKQVRQTGLSFLVYLLLGAICGQTMLMAQAWQYYEVGEILQLEEATAGSHDPETGAPLITTWAQCHAQPLLLFLHLELHAAPLAAKLWRMQSKIRKAETVQISLWDARARRLAGAQIMLLLAVMIAHVIVALQDYGQDRRLDCVDDTNAVQSIERYFFAFEAAIVGATLLPAFPLLVQVSASSFAGIFPTFPFLVLSLFVVFLETCIYGESFFTGAFFVVSLFARFLYAREAYPKP